MQVKKFILNSNPDISVNILESSSLNYTLQIESLIISSEKSNFQDISELRDDLIELLTDELPIRFPDNDELYDDSFIEKLEFIK